MPQFIIDFADKWVSIDFLDERLRKYLCYSFKETRPGQLFLKGAYFWGYEGDNDSESYSKIFSFEDSGRLVIAERNVNTGEVREWETTASLEENWESYPEFGEYSSLCKTNRANAR